MIELEQHFLGNFRQLNEIFSGWHPVNTPRGKTRTEITEWLEANVTNRYYWDDSSIHIGSSKLWLESLDDQVYFQLVWEHNT